MTAMRIKTFDKEGVRKMKAEEVWNHSSMTEIESHSKKIDDWISSKCWINENQISLLPSPVDSLNINLKILLLNELF